VHIELPISVPDDEVDGYTYTNSATAEAPHGDLLADAPPSTPPSGRFDYGFTLTDTGDLRVVKPVAPLRCPSKSGPWMVDAERCG
jgi:hypothetical protein